MAQARALAEETLQEIVRRIVEVADPVKIVLFGSAARGDMGPHSDADFLVVVEPGRHRRELAGDIHMSFWGIRQAIDVVVVTTEDVELYKDSPSVVIYPALQEGRVVYERP
ncbi:nucleotidyltransferase domain-containing protein [soil metagenome]